jgi:hypothetical protein
VVECAALEMRYRGDPIGGSNPSLSAIDPYNDITIVEFIVFRKDDPTIIPILARLVTGFWQFKSYFIAAPDCYLWSHVGWHHKEIPNAKNLLKSHSM